MEPTPMQSPVMEQPKQNSHRTFVYSLIIIAVVVVSAIVIMSAGRDLGVFSNTVAPMETESRTDSVREELRVQGDSTNLNDIEADLNATNLDSIEQ